MIYFIRASLVNQTIFSQMSALWDPHRLCFAWSQSLSGAWLKDPWHFLNSVDEAVLLAWAPVPCYSPTGSMGGIDPCWPGCLLVLPAGPGCLGHSATLSWWHLSSLLSCIQGWRLWCFVEFVWCSMSTHNMVFLHKRLLGIFEDSGRGHVGRGVDRDINLGGVYFQKTGIKERKWNRNLEKNKMKTLGVEARRRDFNKMFDF